jgi:hypothetical protein
MKTKNLSIPISMTAALIGLIACAASCAKKSDVPPPSPPAPPEPPVTNTVPPATNSAAAAATNAAPTEASVTMTNVQPAPEITNPPPAETTIKAPEAPAMTTMSETNLPGHTTVVEMPATAPVAPTNFYPAEVTSNLVSSPVLQPIDTESGSTNYSLRLRGGYEHINHGDNNDSYWVSAKLYAYGDGLREQAGKNGWLIPDTDAEISSGELAKPDNNRHPGSDSGLQFRADFTWPWVHWTSLVFAQTNSDCPFCKPLNLTLGPTVNLGFDHLYDEAEYRFARYAGLRLTFNRTGFIEYTVGDTEGLNGTRQQIVTELPFYESRDGEVRYYVRGLWNHGASNRPDILEGGVFLEMSLSALVSPDKWGDLVPFGK